MTKEKEFNLSEKILTIERTYDTDNAIIRKAISTRKVKEFIKRLKEELSCDCGNAYRCPNCQMILRINKLAGKDLI